MLALPRPLFEPILPTACPSCRSSCRPTPLVFVLPRPVPSLVARLSCSQPAARPVLPHLGNHSITPALLSAPPLVLTLPAPLFIPPCPTVALRPVPSRSDPPCFAACPVPRLHACCLSSPIPSRPDVFCPTVYPAGRLC